MVRRRATVAARRPAAWTSTVGDEFETVLAIEIEHRRRRLFDRPSGDVDGRPAALGEEATRRCDFFGDRDAVDIVGLRVGVERKKPVLPDLHNSVRRGNKSDDQRTAKMVDGAGQGQTRHDGHVGGLISAIGEVDAGWGLRSAAHPKQNDIGMLQILRAPGHRR